MFVKIYVKFLFYYIALNAVCDFNLPITRLTTNSIFDFVNYAIMHCKLQFWYHVAYFAVALRYFASKFV